VPVILARGCRTKNPDLFAPSERQLRDSSRTPDTRGNDKSGYAGTKSLPLSFAILNNHPATMGPARQNSMFDF
jgi:hypothetical protein